MSEKVSGSSSASRMWSMTRPTVQNGGTATKSVCMRRPAVSWGYSRLRSTCDALAGGNACQDLLPGRRLEAFQQIRGVIRLELGDRLGHHVLRQGRQQLVADRGVELGEHLRAKGRAQRLDQGIGVAPPPGARSDRRGRRALDPLRGRVRLRARSVAASASDTGRTRSAAGCAPRLAPGSSTASSCMIRGLACRAVHPAATQRA